MRNPLNKTYKREIRQDLGKYIALFLFLTLTIGFISGFLVAGGSMKTAYDESFEKYAVEDGHFTLAIQANDELTEKIEAEQVKVYPLYNKSFNLDNGDTVRIYKERKSVDRICLMDGKMPEKNGQIVIDRLYAENNGIEINDKMSIDGKSFEICGVVAFSDYSALFKNTTDMMFDANKFTVACVTDDDFDSLSDKKIKYTYAWRIDDRTLSEKEQIDKADKIKNILSETGLITDYIKTADNPAIQFTGDDIGKDSVMMTAMLYIIMAVLAFIFGVSTRNTIEKESGTIGTLRASGYTRAELWRHYMFMPILVTVIAAIVGNVMGYTFMKHVVVMMYYHSYSLPTYVTLWNMRAFILTTVIPGLIVWAVVFVVLFVSLKLSPLQFLRHELKPKKKNKVIKLKHFNFITRYRIRIIFQNLPAYFTLFAGVLFASVLLMFGMMMSPLLTNFRTEVLDSKIADYQYVLKAPVEVEYAGAEKYAVCALQTDTGEEITVYGIDSDSTYMKDKAVGIGSVLVTYGLSEKYGIESGDTLELFEKYEEKSYNLKVTGKYNYPAALAVFMSRDTFNRVFEKADGYFTGYFSDKKLTDIDEMYIATVITQSDLTVIADQLDDSMGLLFLLMCGFSVIMYIILIYLLAKQIIEKNINAISMIKILGYSDKEVASLYSKSTGVVMVISLIFCLPLCHAVIKLIYYAVMKKFNGWLTFYIAPWIYPVMFLTGFICYVAVYFLQMKKIRKIPMGEALKNVE